MKKRQAIVVGAGPAGSTTAFYLAKNGVDVLLVDKETWPRDKVCGDAQVNGVFPVYKEMGIYEEAVEASSNFLQGFRFSGVEEEIVSFFGIKNFALCTPRRIIDDIIRRAAIEKAGADFLENYEVIDLIIEKGVVKGVKALYNNKLIEQRADIVVLCNGSHSMQARKLGIFNEDPELAWYGARAYYEGVEGMDMRCCEEHFPHEMFFPAGYMWVFPQNEERKVANIGVFITEESLTKSGMRLEDFFDWWRDNTKIGQERLGNAKLLGEIKGWKLPSCRQIGDNVFNGCICVGDAGNGIECLQGEGFKESVISGRAAGNYISEALKKGDVSKKALDGYTALISEELNWLYALNTAVRDNVACNGTEYSKFIKWVQANPHLEQEIGSLPAYVKYMNEILGITKEHYLDRYK